MAVVAFCAVATEGAMFDWAAVYLRREFSAPEATAALAPSFFSGAMAGGRLGGDQLTGGELEKAVEEIVEERLEPDQDIHATAGYRMHLAGRLGARTARQAVERMRARAA